MTVATLTGVAARVAETGRMASVTVPTTRGWGLPDLPRPPMPVPFLDRESMIQIDRVVTDQIGISLLQLMENAGHQLADLVRQTLGGAASRRVVVLAGTGNNAGGGLVAARRLSGWGADVRVAFARPVLHLRPAPCSQLDALLASGARAAVIGHDQSHVELAREIRGADAVVDALIGYRLRGVPDEAHRLLIAMAGAGHGAVISLDLPSGIDADSGEAPGAAVSADATLALGLPKLGIERGEGRRAAGTRYLADIGIPPAVLPADGQGLAALFAAGPLLRLD
jgi:NAD(P)H-hydrate epimerase